MSRQPSRHESEHGEGPDARTRRANRRLAILLGLVALGLYLYMVLGGAS